jgi:hypothetical protein
MIKISKTKADGKFLYINIHGFRDDAECDLVYKKIRDGVIHDHNAKLRVF